MAEADLISEAQAFIVATHGQRFSGTFADYLKDGVVLCEFRASQ